MFESKLQSVERDLRWLFSREEQQFTIFMAFKQMLVTILTDLTPRCYLKDSVSIFNAYEGYILNTAVKEDADSVEVEIWERLATMLSPEVSDVFVNRTMAEIERLWRKISLQNPRSLVKLLLDFHHLKSSDPLPLLELISSRDIQ